jgi:hypothetical protein
MNVEFLREQIDRCRRLAKQAEPEKRLLDLATDRYEARIIELEKGHRRSPASRLLSLGERQQKPERT